MTDFSADNENLELELKQLFENIDKIAASVDLYETIVEEKVLTEVSK